jgi:threonine dehydrogenase-like Zn-dependent dehydrogenase
LLAITAIPGRPDTAGVTDVAEPTRLEGEVLAETLLIGLCGTDREVLHRTPRNGEALVLGHEVVGRVVDAPEGSGFHPGSLVVGVIRRPCPEQCAPCRAGAQDACATFPPVERGIWRADGFGSERWASDPSFLCRVPATLGELGFLAEPASCIVKGLARLDEIRGRWPEERRALVLGAGTIGCLTVVALTQRGMDIDVVDPNVAPDRGELLAALGARLLREPSPGRPYALGVETSGSADGLATSLGNVGMNGRVLVLGLSPTAATIAEPARLAMGNVQVVFSVNATREHYDESIAMLGRTDRAFLSTLVGREVDPVEWTRGLEATPTAVKTVVRFR